MFHSANISYQFAIWSIQYKIFLFFFLQTKHSDLEQQSYIDWNIWWFLNIETKSDLEMVFFKITSSLSGKLVFLVTMHTEMYTTEDTFKQVK